MEFETPQYNGVVERMNRTICDKIWFIFSYAKLPRYFYGEAMHTTCYLINHLQNHWVGITEKWCGLEKMPISSTWRCLGARHLFMYQKIKEPRLMISRGHAFSWAIGVKSLVICFGILKQKSWLEVEMSFSLKTKSLTTLKRQEKHKLVEVNLLIWGLFLLW